MFGLNRSSKRSPTSSHCERDAEIMQSTFPSFRKSVSSCMAATKYEIVGKPTQKFPPSGAVVVVKEGKGRGR